MSTRPSRSAARVRTAAAAIGVMTIAAAGFIGWAVGRAATPEPTRAPAFRAADAGPARVTIPSDWVPAAAAASGVRGLDPDATATFSLSPGLRAFGLVSFSRPDDASLVPSALRTVLEEPPTSPKTGLLAGRPAWQYPGLPTTLRDGLMDVSVVATSEGVLTVACVASRSVWAAASSCASDVRSIALEGGRVLTPPDLVFRVALDGALAELEESRTDGQAALRAARTRKAQTAAARGLATAHSSAATALAASAPDGEAAATVGGLLRRTADGYDRLADAAAAGSVRRYDAARTAVREAEAGLAEALVRMEEN